MPQIVYTRQATLDLARLADFMQAIAPNLRQRSLAVIVDGIDVLSTFPELAKCAEDEPYAHLRELFIPFGKAGYVVLYEYREQTETVIVSAIRHTRESGYKLD